MDIKITPYVKKIKDCKPKVKPPTSVKVTLAGAKPFAQIWPEIIAFRMTHSQMSNQSLWKHFKSRISDMGNYSEFRAAIVRKGLDKSSVTEALSEKQMTKNAIQTFADKIKEKADIHLNKCAEYIDRAHQVVDEIKVDQENIGGYISLVKEIHREGRLLYNIDEQKVSDPTLLNLALLVAVRPESEAEIETIDV